MSKKGWKYLKFGGILLGMLAGIATAAADGGELIEAYRDMKSTPELPGPVSNEEEQ